MNSNDAKVLEALRNARVDMSVSHQARHYLYVSDRAVAEQLAQRIGENGYKSEVHPGVDRGTWLVLAVRIHVLTEAEVTRIRTVFDSLASEFGAEYDGWEVGIRTPPAKAH